MSTNASQPMDASPPQQPLLIVKPTPLHPLEEVPLNLQPSASSIGSSALGANQPSISDDPRERYHLPAKGTPDQASQALDKLDRITKAQQSKTKWRRATGIEAVTRAASKKVRKADKPDDGYNTDSSSDSINLTRAYDEVKLMITSLPGHPVVGRVKNVASKAKGRLHRGELESPEGSPQLEDGPESGSYRFPLGRGINAAARKFSFGKPPTPLSDIRNDRQQSPLPASSDQAAKTSPPPSDTFQNRTGPSLNPELLVVDEEGHERQAEEQDESIAGPSRFPRRSSNQNRFGSASPKEAPSNPTCDHLERPPMIPSTSSSSFFGGIIHDQPEETELTTVVAPGRLQSPGLSPSSASDLSVSEEAEGDASALATDSSDDELDDEERLAIQRFGQVRKGSLNLDHGEALTKDEIKRRKKLLKQAKRRGSMADVPEGGNLGGRASNIGQNVSRRVSKGLHYASSQSRNRRAMEKYSPNPTVKLNQIVTKDLPRSNTPGADSAATFSPLTPSASRSLYGGGPGSRRGSIAEALSGNGPNPSISLNGDELEGGIDLRRWNTGNMSISSSKGSIRHLFHAPSVFRRGRRKTMDSGFDALAAGDTETPPNEDPERELDTMLGKLAAEQAPIDARKEKFEFDVLYENQRGLLVFGIPKFSPRTLFQWDPSPWTSADNKKSPYNVANAQLPDPSWEWVYPEWLIDMTGDTDEAGWQYSGNFGRRFWPQVHFPHGKVGLPKGGVDGVKEMEARRAAKEAKRKEREEKREDDGFEALKRTAQAKTIKWQGTPDPWTFVRRRRWIRLRRRRPLTTGSAPESRRATPATELDNPIGETLSETREGVKADKKALVSDDDDSSSIGDEDGSSSSDSDAYSLSHAPAGAGPSAFLPRRLPGQLANGPNPLEYKSQARVRKARKEAREFTGTLRELKSLLPSILSSQRDGKHYRSSSGMGLNQNATKNSALKLSKIDARNPFISWKFVKMRLEDGDMAFASATLRAMERRYQQRITIKAQKSKSSEAGRPSIPSRFADKATASDEGAGKLAPSALPDVPESVNFAESEERKDLTREALIEINYRRVLRVLKACKVDRQRMDLWKVWLGIEPLDNLLEAARREELRDLGLLDSEAASSFVPPASIPSGPGLHFSGGSSIRYRNRRDRVRAHWRSAVSLPDPSDVWDVLERKLDDVLLLFEFQSSRALLIKTLLTFHSFSHPEHMYKDHSIRAAPSELSPTHQHGRPSEMGGIGEDQEGWKRAGLPRLEFFSDLAAVLNALPGTDAVPEHRVTSLEAASTSTFSFLNDPSSEVLNLPPTNWSGSPAVAQLHRRSESPALAQLQRRAESPSLFATSTPGAASVSPPPRTDSVSPRATGRTEDRPAPERSSGAKQLEVPLFGRVPPRSSSVTDNK